MLNLSNTPLKMGHDFFRKFQRAVKSAVFGGRKSLGIGGVSDGRTPCQKLTRLPWVLLIDRCRYYNVRCVFRSHRQTSANAGLLHQLYVF